VTPEGLVVREVAPGVTFEEVQEASEPRLIRPLDLREMEL
jgi:acyl CoA:acetate/3-ketoacid CoA transferase beta subunit